MARNNVPVPLYGFVIGEKTREKKNGDPFWQTLVKTNYGTFECVIWDHPTEKTKDNFPYIGDVILISEYRNQLDTERKNIIIDKFNKIDKNSLPENEKQILERRKISDVDKKYANELIFNPSLWSNEKYRKFVGECIIYADPKRFQTCPAATDVHHAYEGGLLLHTAEVLATCKGIAESVRYPLFNKDVLYASAILHDIGKTVTYKIDDMGLPTKSLKETSVGHIFYSMKLIHTVYDNQNIIEENWFNEVLHCIASHHGDVKFGSIKECMTFESIILSKADMISARSSTLDDYIKINNVDDKFKVFGDNYISTSSLLNYKN